jgi:hypothetical protein
MLQARTVCGFAALMTLCAAPAHAQRPLPSTSKYFASVNAGAQLAPRTLDVSTSRTVYDETGTLNASLPIGKGFIPDFAAGYRVFGNIFVGLGVSIFSDSGTATTIASVPDPFFYGLPKTVTGTQPDLKHTETQILPQLIYTRAISPTVDFVGGIGPAIVRLSQDAVNSFAVAPGTQDVTIGTSSESATGIGVNASIGLNYNLNRRFAVGGFVRYGGASVTLPSATDDQNVGGMQAGAGLRMNF